MSAPGAAARPVAREGIARFAAGPIDAFSQKNKLYAALTTIIPATDICVDGEGQDSPSGNAYTAFNSSRYCASARSSLCRASEGENNER
jgi:hypothetical protein